MKSKSDFITRYGIVLEATARRVHTLAARGQTYTSTSDIAFYIMSSLPTLARATWGKGMGVKLKQWRIVSMLNNAKVLGAYEDLDIRVVHGKGLTTVVRPRLKLKVVQGGRR